MPECTACLLSVLSATWQRCLRNLCCSSDNQLWKAATHHRPDTRTAFFTVSVCGGPVLTVGFLLVLCCFCWFVAESLCVAPWLAWNSQRSACFPLLSAGVKDTVYHLAQLSMGRCCCRFTLVNQTTLSISYVSLPSDPVCLWSLLVILP